MGGRVVRCVGRGHEDERFDGVLFFGCFGGCGGVESGWGGLGVEVWFWGVLWTGVAATGLDVGGGC